MARKTEIKFYPYRKAYVARIGGKFHTLFACDEDDRLQCVGGGPNFTAALKRYREILEGVNVTTAGDTNPLSQILDKYLRWAKENLSASTFTMRQTYSQSFLNHFGPQGIAIADLRPFHVSEWLSTRTTWNSSTKAIAYDCIVIAINWAVTERLITSNPVKAKKRRPKSLTRSKENLIYADQHQKLLDRSAKWNPTCNLVLRILWHSGARPHEVTTVEAKDLRQGCIICPAAKTKRRSCLTTAKDSVVFLNDDLMSELKALSVKYPTGPLFRTESGAAWDQPYFNVTFQRMRKGCKLPNGISAYSYRHAYATDSLRQGVNHVRLANLMNTSVGMLEKHYGHLDAYGDEMRAAACGVRSEPAKDRKAEVLAMLQAATLSADDLEAIAIIIKG